MYPLKTARNTFRAWLLLLLGLLCVADVQAQSKRLDVAGIQALLPSPGILRNSISNLHAEGDSLWVGPFLNLTTNGGTTWQVSDADSLVGFRNRVYSIDVEGDVIWAGLGITQEREANGRTETDDVAKGFLFSEDGGTTWTYRSPLAPSDNDPNTTGILDLPEDTLTTYGNVQLPTLAITTPVVSPPWDIDYDPITGTVWSSNQLAGIRKSTDKGRTWQRIVLPPDTTDFLSPDLGYVFPFFVQPIGIGIEQFKGLNFQTYAVLVDKIGRVWAGSVGGINVSLDQGVSWRNFDLDDGLGGEWVISLEEQLLPGKEPAIWATTWPGINKGEQFGVAVTRDGGQTFEVSLLGERVYDFAFRGETVYAAGENGLFISDDGGITWRTVRDFYDPTQPDRTFRPGASIFAVATTNNALWVGTGDGLFRSSDGGATWRVFRAEVPLNPDNLLPIVPANAVPEVEAYAYPNPFSPANDRFVRIRYKLDSPATVDVRVFDFGMKLVRDVTNEFQSEGEREISWDGTDNSGVRVANGAYFYAVQTGSETFWGKILVLE